MQEDMMTALNELHTFGVKKLDIIKNGIKERDEHLKRQEDELTRRRRISCEIASLLNAEVKEAGTDG